MGQVSDLLGSVAEGKLETGQAADRLRRMKLAQRTPPEAAGLMALGQDDPTGYPVTDDGHEITDAYHDGKLTTEQYGVLAQAAAESRGKR